MLYIYLSFLAGMIVGVFLTVFIAYDSFCVKPDKKDKKVNKFNDGKFDVEA